MTIDDEEATHAAKEAEIDGRVNGNVALEQEIADVGKFLETMDKTTRGIQCKKAPYTGTRTPSGGPKRTWEMAELEVGIGSKAKQAALKKHLAGMKEDVLKCEGALTEQTAELANVVRLAVEKVTQGAEVAGAAAAPELGVGGGEDGVEVAVAAAELGVGGGENGVEVIANGIENGVETHNRGGGSTTGSEAAAALGRHT